MDEGSTALRLQATPAVAGGGRTAVEAVWAACAAITGNEGAPLDVDAFESRYETIEREVAQELWATEYRLCKEQCSHGPNCKNRATCTFGKRMQERWVLTADACLALLVGADAVLEEEQLARISQQAESAKAAARSYREELCDSTGQLCA